MRKNIASVIDAFHAHEKYQDRTCRTDGRLVYSYGMLIAARAADGTVMALDPRFAPSVTTRGHMRAIVSSFPGVRIVDSIVAQHLH